MKNCSKCNSENIKKTGPFVREVKGGKWEEQSEQMVNYSCLNCGNAKSVKFSEDQE